MFVGYHIHLLRLNEGYQGTKGVFSDVFYGNFFFDHLKGNQQ
jgi:hypothetical protein